MTMSESKRSEYFDDFEIITEANESAFLEQNESKNMETNSEAEMSAQDKPKPKPRNRETNKDYDIHNKRELKWTNEKDDFLTEIENLKESLKQKDEELQEQNSKHEEVINALENEKEALQNKCVELEEKNSEFVSEKERVCEKVKELQEQNSRHEEVINTLGNEKEALLNKCVELEAKNAEFVSEKERACEIIKELQERSEETTGETQAPIQQLPKNEVDQLRKNLDENNDSCNEALEKIQVYESKESENEQRIQRLEEELANLSQQNDLGNRKIDELESTNQQIQEDRAKGEEMLTKLKEHYAELSTINDEMEKELHESKTKVRELTRENQQEKNEMRRQMEKFSNNAREIQSEKDKLESELVTMKLEQQLLTSENTSHSHHMQDMRLMRSKVTKLVEERDFYDQKCKELEKGLKLNAHQEISRLNQALQALNEENDVLRQRYTKLEGDVGTPPRDTPTEQWYETDEGSPLFAQIHREMNNKFSKVEIDRVVSTKDILLSVTTDQREKFKVHFPRNFPSAVAKVKYGGVWKEMRVSFDRNAPSELCTELIKMLCELVYG